MLQFGKKEQSHDMEFFSIYDSKVGVYRDPVLAINKHDILRQVDSLFRDPNQKSNQLLTNAEDFSIFKCGAYDRKTGTITSFHPEHIANLIDLKWLVVSQIKQEGINPT